MEDMGPYARIAQRASVSLDAELRVQQLVRIGDEHKGQIFGMGSQLGLVRMKDYDLPDTGPLDLSVPPRDCVQMEVANRATGETPELQMSQLTGGGNLD